MPTLKETADDPGARTPRGAALVPGVVLIQAGDRPAHAALPLADGALVMGRAGLDALGLADDRLSRQHARFELQGGRWQLTDLASRNGSFVDGARVFGTCALAGARVVRLGRALFLTLDDLSPHLEFTVEPGPHAVVGPTLRRVWAEVRRAATLGDTLLVTGESGSGKELAARQFHAATERSHGPFIAVNCAAIPEGLAERLLFGARKGAFSGATADALGYVQAAHGGTLFLDEVAELDLRVQAKLLRVLEERTVLPLGASQAVPVDLRVVSATHDLRAAVAAGKFRADLFYRLGVPEVRLPPLRERPEEVPWLLARGVQGVDARLVAGAALTEAVLLRPWPGNLRELLAEARRAAGQALAAGRLEVLPFDLAPSAGQAVAPTGTGTATGPSVSPRAPTSEPDRAAVTAALQRAAGNVSEAARSLGLHRTQLRRWLERHELTAAELAGDDGPTPAAGAGKTGSEPEPQSS